MPNQGFMANAAGYCRKLTARSKSSFYYAFLFLPPEKRAALESVYAFCRLVDDVVDEDASDEQKLAGLARWRAEAERVFTGEPTEDPVTARLQEAARLFALRKEDLVGIIDGCAMDVGKTRYATWDELHQYCYRVASCVGLLCVEIFGYAPHSEERVRSYAVNLGMALQLTNILRDVAEDARRGRVYLPAEDLERFGVTVEDLMAERRSPAFHRLMRYEAARARAHYLRARASIGECERRQLVIAEIMGDIYYALLERLEQSQFDIFGAKQKIHGRRKMAIALRNFAQATLGRIAFGG